MPKDKRLYMTFPNGFWMHPKIRPLSDNAFRVFVEINGYSRLEDLDGRVPVPLAQSMWKKRSLDELCSNHPERPSLTVEGTEYVIWNYAEHQLTKADREEESARNAENGRKGGRPRSVKPTETDPLSVRQARKSQSQSQESESEIETDMTNDSESGHVPDSAPRGLDEAVISLARSAGIHDLEAVRSMLEKAAGQPVSNRGAVELAKAIASKAKTHIRKVDSYIATACRRTPTEIQEAYFDLDIGALA